jgi:membrane protein DedA with SNARE-associated domain
MIEFLQAAIASPWVYPVLFAVSLIDAFLPVVPSEALVIAAAVFAAQRGEPNLPAVIAVMALAAALGDYIAYWIGGRSAAGILGRLTTGTRLRAAIDSAQNAVSGRGGLLLVFARYIPGGRPTSTLAMGAIGYPLRRFVLFDTLAAATWALYAAMIGYLGGTAFHHDTVKGLIFGLGLAAGVTVLVQAIRRVRRARLRATTASDIPAPSVGEARPHTGRDATQDSESVAA